MKRYVNASAVVLAALSLVAASCGGSSSGGESAAKTTAASSSATTDGKMSATTDGKMSATTDGKMSATTDGEMTATTAEETEETTAESTAAPTGASDDANTVTIWSSVDQPVQDGLNKVLSEKAKAAGITINWQKVTNIDKVIIQRVQAGDTPDIVMVPQPGVMKEIVGFDAAKPLDDVLDVERLKTEMTSGTLETGQVDGTQYGLLVNMNVKSLVFYNKKAWEQTSYEIPKSIDELNALTDQIRNDGKTPWCMGIESGDGTGWPATDWIEDLVMRYGGAEDYNKWVDHEIPFNSDLVKQAAGEFETLMFTDGNVLGGREAIASTSFMTAGVPMFDPEPACWMFKQGSFITGFFPDDVQADLDANVGVFGFPPATVGGDNPVLGGGDLAVMLRDTDQTKQVMQMLSESDIGSEAIKTDSFLSPFKTTDLAEYPSKITAEFAGIAYNTTAFLFDGSDNMPAEVGNGSFWKEMTAWVAGSEDLDTALTNIDDSWP